MDFVTPKAAAKIELNRFKAITVMTLVRPKAAAKLKLSFNKPASDNSILN